MIKDLEHFYDSLSKLSYFLQIQSLIGSSPGPEFVWLAVSQSWIHNCVSFFQVKLLIGKE